MYSAFWSIIVSIVVTFSKDTRMTITNYCEHLSQGDVCASCGMCVCISRHYDCNYERNWS